MVLFLASVLLPYKSIDFGDEAYYLYSAWSAATPGVPFDSLLPQVAFYIVSGLFFGLGIDSYLGQRYLLLALTLISFSLLLLALRQHRKSVEWPVLLIIPATAFYTTVLSYQNAPVLFLISGLSLYYLSLHQQRYVAMVMRLFSAVCLALLCIVYFPAVIAALLVATAMVVIHRNDPKLGRIIALAAVLVTTFLTYYISVVGFDTVSQTPTTGQHGLSVIRTKVFDVLWVLAYWIVIFSAIRYLIVELSRASLVVVDKFLIILVLPLSILCFGTLIVAYFSWGSSMADHLPVFLQNHQVGPVEFLWTLHPTDMLAMLSLAIFSLGVSCNLERIIRERQLLMFALSCLLLALIQITFSAMRISNALIFYAGLFAVLGFWLILDRLTTAGASPWMRAVVVGVLYLFVGLGLWYQANFSFGATPLISSSIRELARQDVLKGLRVEEDRLHVVSEVGRLYESSNCADKGFLALPNGAMFHFLLKRSGLNGKGWLHPVASWPEDDIASFVAQHSGWCIVIIDTPMSEKHKKVVDHTGQVVSEAADREFLGVPRVGTADIGFQFFVKDPN